MMTKIIFELLTCMFMMVMFVSMLMHVLILFLAVNRDMRMRAFYAALDALFEAVCDIRNAYRIKFVFTSFNVARKLRKRCQEHVSCCAHIAFDIESLHGLTSDVVDHAGRISCTESVVDINDSNTART